jgi:hypothetical protein
MKPQSMGDECVRDSWRILILSIVNPEVDRNGAATVTRGLMKALSSPPFRAVLDSIPVRREPHKWHRIAQARSVVVSFVSDLPAKAVFLKSREFREKVEARLRRQKYDVIVLNGSDLLDLRVPATLRSEDPGGAQHGTYFVRLPDPKPRSPAPAPARDSAEGLHTPGKVRMERNPRD